MQNFIQYKRKIVWIVSVTSEKATDIFLNTMSRYTSCPPLLNLNIEGTDPSLHLPRRHRNMSSYEHCFYRSIADRSRVLDKGSDPFLHLLSRHRNQLSLITQSSVSTI